MSEELEKFRYEIWNEEARRQLETEINFVSKEKIELPKGKDYLELFSATHKTDEEIMEEQLEEKDKEITKLNKLLHYANDEVVSYTNECIRLNNIIDELEKYLKENSKQSKIFECDRYYKSILDKLKELKEGK